METVKADNRQRVRIPDIKPGQVFALDRVGNMIKLTPVKPVEEEVPVVKMIRRPDGTYRFPDGVKLTREEIRTAIRADRDLQ
jgi:ATP-dependent 26S proteasome regulatory subunit